VRLLKTVTKWQFWASLALMVLFIFGLYHFTFKVWLASYTNHNQEIAIPDLSKMSVQEAVKTLDKLGLVYEIDSVKHYDDRPVYSIIEFYPAAGFKVKEGRRVFLKSNPKSWQPVEMPDIVGKSKRLAFTQLKISGLEVGDTIYEPDLAKDAVLRVMYRGKQIEKGIQLPRFAKVDLVLGKGLEYGVSTPNLIGLNLDAAKTSILANQFEIGRITVQGSFLDSLNLKVFYQFPIKGDNYDQGLPVDLWVSEQTGEALNLLIKDLDRQYKNVSENDSISTSIYQERLPEESSTENVSKPKLPTGEQRDKQKGIEFVD